MEKINNTKETVYANSVFEQPWWLDIVAEGKWSEIVVKENNSIIARMPFVIEKSCIKNPLYTQTLGIWMSESIRTEKRGNEQLNKQKEVISKVISQFPERKNINIILDKNVEYVLPFRWHGFRIEPTFSYRISNLEEFSNVEKMMGKNTRRDIRLGQKQLFIDDDSSNIDEFIHLQNLTYQRQKRKNPVDNTLTENIIRKTIESGHGKLFIAKDENNNAHGGAFMIFDENSSYHLLSGQDTRFGNDGAMPLIMYSEILFASKVSQYFDFEGSMVEGIEQTYRRFGGEIVTNWNVIRQTISRDIISTLKPRVKKILHYRI